jgi:hypothetical protein
MSIGNCQYCTEFLQKAALSIKQHLEATAKLTEGMQHGMSDSEISALKEASRAASAARSKAVAEYKKHIAEHVSKASAANE